MTNLYLLPLVSCHTQCSMVTRYSEGGTKLSSANPKPNLTNPNCISNRDFQNGPLE